MSGYALSRPIARQPRGVPAQVGSGWGSVWLGWLAAVLNAVETRRHLAQMDDRMLKDIGISRTEALREAERAPWDLKMPRTPFG